MAAHRPARRRRRRARGRAPRRAARFRRRAASDRVAASKRRRASSAETTSRNCSCRAARRTASRIAALCFEHVRDLWPWPHGNSAFRRQNLRYRPERRSSRRSASAPQTTNSRSASGSAMPSAAAHRNQFGQARSSKSTLRLSGSIAASSVTLRAGEPGHKMAPDQEPDRQSRIEPARRRAAPAASPTKPNAAVSPGDIAMPCASTRPEPRQGQHARIVLRRYRYRRSRSPHRPGRQSKRPRAGPAHGAHRRPTPPQSPTTEQVQRQATATAVQRERYEDAATRIATSATPAAANTALSSARNCSPGTVAAARSPRHRRPPPTRPPQPQAARSPRNDRCAR